MKLNNKSGFTLLEIIIVIIIVGILASLALPRFFSTVEYSKSTEAFAGMTALRQSMERCYLQAGGNYTACTLAGLDVENPQNSPGAHFTYAIAGQGLTGYAITGTRNTSDGGDGTSTITLTQTSKGVTRAGTGKYAGVR